MNRLSIIIPAYNVENYIDTLVESIYGSKIDSASFEVIIVDDGSTDGTYASCEELKKKYDNLILLHQSNSGSPSRPRNKGVLNATGKYIFFADADDYFFPDAVKKIIEYINHNDVDVALFKVDASDWSCDYYNGLFDRSQENCNVYNSKIMNSLGPYKLFKRNFLIENNILFPENIIYEELPFVMECYMRAEKISIVADTFYYKYVKREGSISTIKEKENFFDAETYQDEITGIKYYLDACARVAAQQKCPQIYVRGIKYSDRLLPGLCKCSGISIIEGLKDINEKIYCDEIRSLLPFSVITRMDALIAGDFELLNAIVGSWPDGPETEFFFDKQTDKQCYKCIPDAGSKKYLICQMPEDYGWGREKLEDPHITRNLITETRLTQSHIFFKGHMDFVRKLAISDKNNIHGKIRFASKSINRVSETVVSILNLKAKKCYASVWEYEFDWEINLPLSELMDEVTGGKQQIAFFLDIMVNGTFVENRFGHRREKGVINKYFENAVLYHNWVLAPTLTEYQNISLNIVPVSFVENQIVNIHFNTDEGGKRIEITGNQGFDNYPGTKIYAVLNSGHSFRLTKGKRRGERGFSGMIPVDKNHIESYLLKIKSEILGGTLEYPRIQCQNIVLEE